MSRQPKDSPERERRFDGEIRVDPRPSRSPTRLRKPARDHVLTEPDRHVPTSTKTALVIAKRYSISTSGGCCPTSETACTQLLRERLQRPNDAALRKQRSCTKRRSKLPIFVSIGMVLASKIVLVSPSNHPTAERYRTPEWPCCNQRRQHH